MANSLKVFEVGSQTTVHQTLHGYSEGHRLLESSFMLPDEAARLMLRMSDLSGSRVVSGFDDYITGYPLSSIDAYVLAKTWYASELPRPGCVWTHSIVIPASVMSSIFSLTSVVNFFKRPTVSIDHVQYKQSLILDKSGSERSAFDRAQIDDEISLGSLFWAYYGLKRPIILTAKTSTEFESSILALWSQQWPKLRLQFTFCTGSLSARSIAGRPLNIQCVPTTSARDVLRETQDGDAKPLLLPSDDLAQSQSISPAVIDAMHGGGPFRHFLWAVTDDSSTAADFVPLVSVFEALGKPFAAKVLISLVAQFFPTPITAHRLKSVLFGNMPIGSLLGNENEQDILLSLATTNDYQSFDAEALSLRERGENLCRQNPESASWLLAELFRSSVNPLGEEVLAGLIAGMDLELARKVTAEHPQFLPSLFRANPSLASSSQLWVAGRDRKRELFESVVTQDRLAPVQIGGIVSALLESESDTFLREAFERWGQMAIFQALDWAEARGGKMSETCRRALAFHVPIVMDWVEETTRSPESLVAVAHVVAPYSHLIAKRDSAIWLQAFRNLRGNLKDGTYMCAFLLALAFRNAPPSPLELVAESFEPVHESAKEQRLSDEAWWLVEPLVPQLSWWKGWDKCERLRRGLVLAFVRYRWPASELRLRIKDNQLLKDLYRSAYEVEGGREFQRDME